MMTTAPRPQDSVVASETRRDQERGRSALFDIIYRQSFGRGKVVLSSGRESDFYFNMKPSMLDPEGAHLIAVELLREVLAAGGEFVGGLEMGAVPITGAVCQYSHQMKTPVNGLFVRKKTKTHGAMKLIEGIPLGTSLKGRRVVVIDDVTTTGDSALLAADACLAEGALVVAVISIVDREEGAAQTFAAKGIPFRSVFSAREFLNYGQK